MKKIIVNKSEKIMLASSFSVILLTVLLLSNTVVQPKLSSTTSNSLKVYLNIDVYDVNGVLKDSRYKPDDLAMNNFGLWVSSLVTSPDIAVTATFTRESAGSDAVGVRHSYIYGFTRGLSGTDGGFIAVGTGTTSPTITNNDLEAEVFTKVEVGDSTYSNGNVTIIGTVPCTSSQNITEAGFYMQNGITNYNYLMFRDTFSDITVVDTDTIVITYTLMLSNEFTDNFGKILCGMLSSIDANEPTKNYTLSDVDGNSITVNYASGEGASPTTWVFDTTYGVSPMVGIGIGTGTTAPDHSDYSLETQVETITSMVRPSYDGGNVTVTAVHVTTGSRAITEVGLFMYVRTTGGDPEQVLLWHDTFTAENVGSGEAVSTTMFMSVT